MRYRRGVGIFKLLRNQRPLFRGAHYLAEHPHTDYSQWTRNIILKKQQGKTNITLEPAVVTTVKPPEGILPYGKTE